MSLPYKPCWYFVLRTSLVGAMTAAMVPAVFAQERTLCGIIQDQTRAVVTSAAVELTNAGTRVNTKTGSEGKFCFDHVKPGEYELIVSQWVPN
jgi:Carboxypeptidase regulatory-like domain